ncbi:helicase C-terminal domain-containing protein [Mycotypha africana]|uniref:helicase C-terminal domain-containing protein n=1 Tax=Mycotypha africana TaxID=64632 RepID=UPI0022FFCD2D|nr:helicase C-terminal domain-containing protein [Mycotypha africana]KAI8973453.1 helicase C-terminal domain-containing protein [Mycotypha africana]
MDIAWREHQERIAAAQLKEQKNESKAAPLSPSELQLKLKQAQQLQETRKRKLEALSSLPSPAPSHTGNPEQPSPLKKAKEEYKPEKSVIEIVDEDDDDFQVPLVRKKMDSKATLDLVDVNAKDELALHKVDGDVNNMATSEEVAALKYDTYKKVPRIFIGSRTHKQIAQLIAELKYNTGYNPRSTILGSREHLCIHPGIAKKKTEKKERKNRADRVSLVDDEEEKCPFAANSMRIVNHSSLKSINRVWEIDDIIELGVKTKGCPYYAARKLYEGAEIIFGPYNYIIDPVIRKILDINLKDSIVILDEAHNIEDAARSAGSLELDEDTLDKIIKEFSMVAKYGGEREAHLQLELIFDQLRDAMMSDNLQYNVNEYERKFIHWTGQAIINKLAEINITKHTFRDMLEPAYKLVSKYSDEIRKEIEEFEYLKKYNVSPGDEDAISADEAVGNNDYPKCVSLRTLQLIQNLFMILGFIFNTEENHADDYQLVFIKAMNQDGGLNVNKSRIRSKKGKDNRVTLWRHELAFWCLNPAIIFRNMCEHTRSVILTSGTLAPLNTFASELGVDFNQRLEANHVIKPSQVWISAIGRGPNNVSLKGVYNTLESLPYQDEVGATLLQIVSTIPFGILCFVPSYKVMDMLLKRWKLTGIYDKISQRKIILSEPKGSNKEEFEEMLKQFYGQIKRVENGEEENGLDGALLLAVFRGKVSEGIDFSDNYCRTVVTLGIPYPGLKDLKVKLKKEYNDKIKREAIDKEVLNGNQWYTAEAYRAMNQALGRCIRHKNDWGAIILLDERFSDPNSRRGLSRWVRELFSEHHGYQNAMGSLREFAANQMERMHVQKLESKKLEEERLKNTIVIEDEIATSEVGNNSPTMLVESKTTLAAELKEKDKVVDKSTKVIDVENISCVSIENNEDADNSAQIIERELAIDAKQTSQIQASDICLEDDHIDASAALLHRQLFADVDVDIDDILSPNDKSINNTHVSSNDSVTPIIQIAKPEDVTNTAHTITNTTICCKCCSKSLLFGPHDSIVSPIQHIPQSVRNELMNDDIVELSPPSHFSTPNNFLQGGPLGLSDFSERTDGVIFCKADEIAFCPLTCVCDKGTVLGLLICLAGKKYSAYQGKVYFSRKAVQINTSQQKRKTDNVARAPVQDMLEIPNTQYSAMSDTSDIFYGL